RWQADVQDGRDARLDRARRAARRLRLHDARPPQGSRARHVRTESRRQVAARRHAARVARGAVHRHTGLRAAVTVVTYMNSFSCFRVFVFSCVIAAGMSAMAQTPPAPRM